MQARYFTKIQAEKVIEKYRYLDPSTNRATTPLLYRFPEHSADDKYDVLIEINKTQYKLVDYLKKIEKFSLGDWNENFR